MKKLIIALACAASFAAVADTDEGAFNNAGFEGYSSTGEENGLVAGKDDSGANSGDVLWYASGTSDASYVNTYTGSERTWSYDAQCGVPTLFKNATSAKYLELNTSGDTLSRLLQAKVNNEEQAYTVQSEVYIDTMVQFTATTEDQTDFGNAKLALWLKEDEDANGGDSTYTLKVRAADYDVSGGTLVPTTYALTDAAGTLTVQPNVWYRLTVTAVKDIIDQSEAQGALYFPVFQIRLDGQLLKAVGTASMSAAATQLVPNNMVLADYSEALTDGYLFLSLAQGAATTTLTAVEFQGSGAIDDFVATTTDPFDAGTVSVDFTLTWTAGLTAVSYTIDNVPTSVANATVAGQTVVSVPAGTVVTVAATADQANWYQVKSGTGDTTVNAATTVAVVAEKAAAASIISDSTTAASLGITGGAFANASGTALAPVVTWAEAYGASPAQVSTMTFASPLAYTDTEKAYLLNVTDSANLATAEATAKEALEITSIAQDENGAWVVTSKAGTTYGNGNVEIWSATAVDGTYSNVSKTGTQLFYKAVLVK